MYVEEIKRNNTQEFLCDGWSWRQKSSSSSCETQWQTKVVSALKVRQQGGRGALRGRSKTQTQEGRRTKTAEMRHISMTERSWPTFRFGRSMRFLDECLIYFQDMQVCRYRTIQRSTYYFFNRPVSQSAIGQNDNDASRFSVSHIYYEAGLNGLSRSSVECFRQR